MEKDEHGDKVAYVWRWWSYVYYFFFEQKTAYEVRISDCGSDVGSSDLFAAPAVDPFSDRYREAALAIEGLGRRQRAVQPAPQQPFAAAPPDLHLVRQREGEFGDARVEKGRAAFDAMRHQAAVELAQELVRQPVGAVGRLRPLQPAGPLTRDRMSGGWGKRVY